MNSRSLLAVSISVPLPVSSTVTSTAVPTAIDLANYFSVGKREVKFFVAILHASTTLAAQGKVTIEECDSTATASFTTVVGYDGSSGTWTSTANVDYTASWHGIVTKRYVRARWEPVTTGTTGSLISGVVYAFPLVRAL